MSARRTKLLCLAVAAAVLAGGTGTWAAFVATNANAGNQTGSGTVKLTDNDLNGAMFTLSGLNPGDTTSRCIKVTYDGTLAATVRLYGATTGTGLDEYLSVTVTRGRYTSPEPSYSSCTNFAADSDTHISGQAPGVIYTGTLKAFPDSHAAGLSDPSGGSPEDWTEGESHVYKIQVTQGDSSAAQGKNATQAFTWEARNATGYKATVLSHPGLAAYWRLGEASGTTAGDEAGGNDGTYEGGVTLGQGGALAGDTDTAAGFDGTSGRVPVPDAPGLDLNGFTVEAWVRLSSYGDTTKYRTILMKGATVAERNYGLWLTSGSNARLHYSYGSTSGTFRSADSTVNLALNTWYHVAFVHPPGGRSQLWVNGRLDSSDSASATPVTSTAPVSIGGPSATYGWFPGVIDEAAVYDRALSRGEIEQHYRTGSGS